MMSEVKLANIDGKELRRELEILFEDKEKKSVFSCRCWQQVSRRQTSC